MHLKHHLHYSMTELKSIIEQEAKNTESLLLYIDVDPDHRTTYLFVKLALICSEDPIPSPPPPPYISWEDLAEKIMSILNLALQAAGLMREPLQTAELKGSIKKMQCYQRNKGPCK